eukprot:3171296-Rhodomonas_salina.2
MLCLSTAPGELKESFLPTPSSGCATGCFSASARSDQLDAALGGNVSRLRPLLAHDASLCTLGAGSTGFTSDPPGWLSLSSNLKACSSSSAAHSLYPRNPASPAH